MHYNTDTDTKQIDYSMTPSYQDSYQVYSEGHLAINSPLANYADYNAGSQMPRGGFPYYVVANPVGDGTNTRTSIIDIAFCEPLYLSPMYFGQGNAPGFYNVVTYDANITFISQAANRFWSHDPTLAGSFASTSFTFGGVNGGPTSPLFGGTQPLLMFNYITPQETQIIPHNMPITYSYFDIIRFPTDFSSVPAGVTQQYSSNNIQLNSVPRRMYIYMRQRNSDLFASANNTDTFFAINNISLQFQNKSGLLASANALQLYQMCVKNHCKQSFTEWCGGPVFSGILNAGQVGTVGGVVCIEFATDIGLDSLQAPGVLSQSQLQLTLTAKNVSSVAIQPTLYIVCVLEGSFTIQSIGQCSTNIGVITPTDILDCNQSKWVNYQDVQRVNGGDFFSGLKDFGTKLWNFATKAHDFVKENK
jgi:hypothetical protein